MNSVRSLVCCSILMSVVFVLPISAQNYTSDARLVAMGGVGGHANDASRLAGNERSYRSIGLPIGLFQVLKNLDVYRPDKKDDFNPLRAATLLASPLHYTFDLKEGTPGEVLVQDIVRGRFSRDLNTYHGFAPRQSYDAQGLVSPTFGYTARLKGTKDGPYHGIYAGVGPYISLGTNVQFDQQLIDILKSSTATYRPNQSFSITDGSNGQVAGALTIGYRSHLALPGGSAFASARDGIYIATNYNYLRGFRRDTAGIRVRFDTDAQGLITLNPTTTPVVVDHVWSSRGNGFAVDVATAVVVNHWEVNFAADGIGNRIDWEDNRLERLTLGNLFQGLSFVKTPLPSTAGKIRVELPVRYSGGGGYHTDRWSARSEVAHGLQDWEYRGGAEYRLVILEFRGGTHYKNKDWQPSGGVGLNITSHFGIDAAVYGSSTNVERKRKPALALSLRLGKH